MADIRCPNCGKNNPDLLDVCQFCLTPLKPESVLRIGDQPTKKNTGELEPILPDWLKDVRQQARESAEEEAAHAANQPQPTKDDPLDFLAGLTSQSGSDEEDVPDWLANLNPPAEPTSQPVSTSETDFFSQFDQNRAEPTKEPAQEDIPSPEKDELSEWFTQASGQPDEFIELDHDAGQIDQGWGSSFVPPVSSAREPAPQEEEDLSWLHNLEETAKQTGDLKAPKLDTDWMANFESPATPSPSSSSGADLSWLDRLGGIDESYQQPFEQTHAPQEDLGWLNQLEGMQSSQPFETPKEKPSAQEDLSWLNNLGAAPEPVQPFDAAPDRPLASDEDLSWLNNLAGTQEPARPFSPPAQEASHEPFSQEGLSWLDELGGVAEPVRSTGTGHEIPPASQEDLSWLQNLGAAEEPASTPPFAETGSLGGVKDERETEPDWLRSAAEAPSMPPPGDLSMDWFTSKEQPVEEKEGASQSAAFSDIFSTPSEPPTTSNQDVDSLFSAEMPDWLSRTEPALEESVASQPVNPPIDSEDALSPVELPSWVQAMRPVEALITEAAPSTEDQPEEKEGPLAGLRGVIPGAAIGSSIRPRSVSLKLQVSNEQQASAALLEEILGSETSPRPLVDASFVASQHVLRWVLAALFLLVLGATIFLGSQTMPVSPSLPAEGTRLSSAVLAIPANSRVLVVIDYEPSLAGEMEATGAPLLDQLVRLGRHNLSFISTSPNGTALVERLLANTQINTAEGFAYQSGVNYRNLGFLPGGSAGVLGFVEGPSQIFPAAEVDSFADYAAVVLLTDHAESGRIWVEQLQNRKQVDPLLAGQPLLVVASAQAGPLLQPYVSSGQVNGMISGLSDAARYEASSNRPGMARSYWDTFGIGLMLAVIMIVVGSLWNLFTGIRARRSAAGQG